ncbi:MAG: hypothetical protein IT340_12560 [Chloroflexi bacterium]|nr:hypothetical protein [Chloroflexota bacterium]
MTDDVQYDLFGQPLAGTMAGKSNRPIFGSPPAPASVPVASAPAPAPIPAPGPVTTVATSPTAAAAPTGVSAAKPAATTPAPPRGKAAPATAPTETELVQGQALVLLLEAMLAVARTSLQQRAGLLPIPAPALDPRLLGGAARLAVTQPALLAQVQFLMAKPVDDVPAAGTPAAADAAPPAAPVSETAAGGAAAAEPAANDAGDGPDAAIDDEAGAGADDDSA